MTGLVAIADETVAIVEAGRYTAPDGSVVEIGDAVAAAVAGTRVYGPEPVAAQPAPGTPAITVTAEDTWTAARRMREPVAVLNFASARTVGGGFRSGARAQEEDLCRCSALHRCLEAVPEYYAPHRASRSVLYSDRVVWSPGVPVFRDRDYALLPRPVIAGVLTCAAPNAGAVRDPAEAARVPEVLRERALRVLQVAVANGQRRLVLGAWGCGVFRNDPAQVAGAFRAGLDQMGGHLDEITFAVLDTAPGAPTRAAFARVFC